jgi:5'-AMP-activated protein kinase catalytic alpha subunit
MHHQVIFIYNIIDERKKSNSKHTPKDLLDLTNYQKKLMIDCN